MRPEPGIVAGAAPPVPARATPSPAILARLIKGAHGSPKACGEIRKARFVAASTRALQHGIHTWRSCSGTSGRGNDRRGTPSLRGVGYSLETAIADLIDNSISAHARNLWITFWWEGRRSHIAILDDGDGMTEGELSEAMRPGSRSPLESRPADDLGRFGLGLKTRLLLAMSATHGRVASKRTVCYETLGYRPCGARRGMAALEGSCRWIRGNAETTPQA